MTTQELINYYADLLIIQYIGKSKAYATIQALVEPLLMTQASLSDPILPLAVQQAFNINAPAAIGVQLDILGKYLGVVRSGYGVNGFISLSDADFLVMIKFAAAKNYSGSSLYDIQKMLDDFFSGKILVTDYKNMHMSYLVNSSLGSQDLIQLIINNGLLPKPMGVQLSVTTYAPIIDKFFGFRTYEQAAVNSSPFNSYADFHTTYLWLSYQNGIGPLIQLEAENGDIIIQENGDLIYTD